MASFDVCFDWTMGFEDPERECLTIPDAPPGVFAISGINSHAFPTDFATINSIARAQRFPSVKRFYQVHFWNSYFAQLASDEVAKRVFDAAVNMGPGIAVRLLQEAIPTQVDCAWGIITLGAANNCDEAVLVKAFRTVRADYYRKIGNPKYIAGWPKRAEA